ncbi:MAG TPA: VOC family protein [Xanthomonadaceae bacterium]|nr:VOC family protein [Xanthomonadaceae bacterium]
MKHIPEGYHSLTPYLYVSDAARALDFYRSAFGAAELFRLPMGEKIGHAEMQIGDSRFMLADEFPDMNTLGPARRGGPTTGFMLYVEDADAAFAKAVSAGATAEEAVKDQFYGDRSGTAGRSVWAQVVAGDARRGRRSRGTAAADGRAGHGVVLRLSPRR